MRASESEESNHAFMMCPSDMSQGSEPRLALIDGRNAEYKNKNVCNVMRRANPINHIFWQMEQLSLIMFRNMAAETKSVSEWRPMEQFGGKGCIRSAIKATRIP